ncbi:pyridoxamine 5'-phosphate oxidase family protein [Sneathiella sp. HT1-7]|uniref:pyridoxamine 5'-phosphate oxidase family protein n=1 Tax=Sneathiella sp. HT1-7 TaxID=2887192 RepID=UPI001D15AD38|nr:pyridoxamine 5'-phosphate oxidase family protein [Sneathiella sp. HT1-7]MCC3305585.1 pyridoxamine 5'-phosphate oxidase family protein [Sneathiella sp. HT1-7]
MTKHNITTIEELYSVYKQPAERAVQKEIPKLDQHCRNFIALSPFLVLSTDGSDGTADASPRGDAPGFVTVLDDNTLAIPDRPGNNRLDSLLNILRNPAVGMIFLVPGINETLRINGTATISLDPELMEAHAVDGKLPRSVLLVKVTSAYMHCAKALIRSKLWDPETKVERSVFPTLGQVLADQIAGMDAEQSDAYLEVAYKENLY